jgi:polar amino acid transport system substrate-binding protein
MFVRLVLPLTLAGLLFAWTQAAAEEKGEPPFAVPYFRHIDPDAKAPNIDRDRHLTFIADGDFPPFSYADAGGAPKGIAVDLALSLCGKLGLQCTVKLREWGDLAPALESGEGSAVISGLKLDDRTLASFDATRPLFRSLARFAVRKDSAISEPSMRQLAGKLIGVVRGSAHEAWLTHYFPGVRTARQESLSVAEQALRQAKVDALFGDGLSLVYWNEGEASQHCCKLLPGAFVDQDYFSRSFVFFVNRGDTALKNMLDYGLDEIQESGEWDKIFRAYVPASLW